MSKLSIQTIGGYRVCCHGGPFDGHTFPYGNLPKILVLMTRPFHYHDYRRVGDTNNYRYVDRRESK